jgi:hypothetical protein
MAILTAFTFVLLVNRRPGVGRILVTLSPDHGIHVGDIPVAAAWVLGMVCLVVLWRDDGRP